MSLHRALAVPKLSPAARRAGAIARFRPSQFVRWQQSGAAGSKGSGVGKLLFYTTAGVGVAAVGSIGYSIYDPAFKDRVSQYAPGFSNVVDSTAGLWGRITGSEAAKKDSVKLVFRTENKDKPVKVGETKPKSSEEPAPQKTADSTKSKITAKSENVKSEKKPKSPAAQEKKESASEPESVATPPPKVIETPKASREVSETKPERSTKQSTKTTEEPAVTKEPSVPTERKSVPHPEIAVDEQSKAPAQSEPEAVKAKKETPKKPLYPVESAVASVKEETDKVAEKIMSEQVKDHQHSQSLGEQWMQDTSEVGAKLNEVFDEFKALSSKVLEAQKAVIEAFKHHQQKVAQVIQTSGEGADSVETLAEDVASSEEAVEDKKKELVDASLEHQEKISALESILSAAEKVGLKSVAEEVIGEISKLMADLAVYDTSIREAESSSQVLRDYQEEAQKSREQLQRELGTVPPKADLKQEAIILMQTKRIEVLKQKLESMEKEKAQSLTAALEKQKEALEQLADEKLRLNLQRQKLQMDQEFMRRESEFAHEYDSELREKLRLQSEAHTSHLTDALRAQAGELGAMWSQELELKLMEQEAQYQAELSKSMARLRGIESMVNTVANAGEITRHQQHIRNACDTLSGALDQANTDASYYSRFTFSRELNALRQAAEGDKFILSVIESIPKQASAESAVGIQSEAALQDRFQNVYRVCKRVALVPGTGGGLGTYALSYLQSLLVFNIRGVNEKKELKEMDTFELLSLASASVQHGDLERAVWYMSHLGNESGRVAQDWLSDARLYLETRQAIRLIQTYTAATNIAFI